MFKTFCIYNNQLRQTSRRSYLPSIYGRRGDTNLRSEAAVWGTISETRGIDLFMEISG